MQVCEAPTARNTSRPSLHLLRPHQPSLAFRMGPFSRSGSSLCLRTRVLWWETRPGFSACSATDLLCEPDEPPGRERHPLPGHQGRSLEGGQKRRPQEPSFSSRLRSCSRAHHAITKSLLEGQALALLGRRDLSLTLSHCPILKELLAK